MRTPGQALVSQFDAITAKLDRWNWLIETLDRPTDLAPHQWVSLAAFALDFQPDLIIELGRGYGNSTAMFLEVCDQLPGCRLLSLCNTDSWRTVSVPKLAKMGSTWLSRGECRECDILEQTINLRGVNRVFLFWDAHGFEIADWMLGYVMPMLAHKKHLVAMHDISDLRYCGTKRPYDGPLWKGGNAEMPAYQIGSMFSRVQQAIAVADFTSRNGIGFNSADTSLHRLDAPTYNGALGDRFCPVAHWWWWTLNHNDGPFLFPTASYPCMAAAA
jgi:hypothetical protein